MSTAPLEGGGMGVRPCSQYVPSARQKGTPPLRFKDRVAGTTNSRPARQAVVYGVTRPVPLKGSGETTVAVSPPEPRATQASGVRGPPRKTKH